MKTLITYNGNNFKGEVIESLIEEDSILPSYWTLTLKNGREFEIAIDWRGHDAYIGLYDET